MKRLLAVALCVLVACGSGSGSGSGSGGASHRPSTQARLSILSPTPNEVTGPDPVVTMELVGARVVAPSVVRGALRGDEGHIHVSLDGKLISMTTGLRLDLHSLSPGPHAVQAEFVADDHLPFANRIVAAVLFTVQ